MSDRIESQHAPDDLQEAIGLLDSILQVGDVPSDARLVLTDVYSELLDVRPPYAPIHPRALDGASWGEAAHRTADALNRLIDTDPVPRPAHSVRWALAARNVRKAALSSAAATNPAADRTKP